MAPFPFPFSLISTPVRGMSFFNYTLFSPKVNEFLHIYYDLCIFIHPVRFGMHASVICPALLFECPP